ncbi:MAG: branched-chain-amino-acid transaminase [Thermoproteota archaeon]
MNSAEVEYVYIDGFFVPREEAKISVWDHGLLYGDGVFEAIRVYDWNIFKLKEHINRLFESAKAIMINIPLSKDELISKTVEIVKKNNLRYGYIRIIVTRGVGPMGVDPRNCKKPTIIIMTERREPIWGERPIVAITSSIRRIPPECIDLKIKSLNYLNNILAKIEAINVGADAAIMLNIQGYVSEASTENIIIVKNSILYTPPLEAGILRGITRETIMEIAKDLNIPVVERNLTIHDLYTADEVFLAGTAAELAPVVIIDGRIISDGKPGPIFKKIYEEYRKRAHDPRYGVKVQ